MIQFVMNTKYSKNELATIQKARYGDGSTALIINSLEDGSCICTATVSLEADGALPAEGNVFIKSYSENEGVLECLVQQGIISEPLQTMPTGFVVVYECKLLV